MIFKRQTKALIRLRVYAGWSVPLLVAHATLLEISCCGSILFNQLLLIAQRNSETVKLRVIQLLLKTTTTTTTIELHRFFCHFKIGTVGPQNAPLHNMLLLVAYCVPCIHNMLRWSILCTLHTQYATSGAYCVGSIHMLFQWSSEGTQYALLENMSCGICLFF